MRLFLTPCLVALMLIFGVPAVKAHSIEELPTQLGVREKFFQPVDKSAPAFALVDAGGRSVTLDDLRGRVLVLHFIYASCPDICPLHAEKIAEVQAMVNQTPMKEQLRFVSITTDPNNDIANVLRDYGPAHGLDPVNWTFLTVPPGQPEETTRRLATAFGLKFKKTDDGYQTDGIITHVIDRDGRWRANFHGLKFEPVNLVLFLNALVNDAQRPHGDGPKSFWDRVKDLF